MATNTIPTKQTHTAANNSSGDTSGPYAISFDYLSESDVEVRVANTLKTQTTHYTFPTRSTIQFTSGNFPTLGSTIEIKRDTDITIPKVDFEDGSVLTESDLDNNSKHILFGMQETKEDVEGLVSTFVGSTAPTGSSVVNGARWYDNVSGRTFIYYVDADTAQWVEANPPFDAAEFASNVQNSNVAANAAIDATKLSFTQSGTGATARTVDSKLGDFVSVKDFGVTGDGSTDDTLNFQAAIDATSTANQRLYIPTGTYIVSSLSLQNNTYLFGVGTLKRKASSTGYVITASSKNNWVIRGFTIDGNKSNATDDKAAIFINGGYQVVVDEITINNHTYDGIGIRNTTDRTQETESYIRNCTVSNSDRYGIEAHDVKDLTIIGNLISNVGNHGILLFGTTVAATDLVTVEGNRIMDTGAAGIAAPYITGTTNFGVAKAQIIDNKVKAAGNNGINVQTNNAVVSNNVCDGNGTSTGHQGILINGEYITVDGNTSINNTGVGIDVGDGKFVTVTNNIVNNNAQIGIEFNSCESCIADGNIVRNNCTGSVTANLKAGITIHKGDAFAGDCVDITVSNNDIKSGSNQTYGISLLANTNRVSIIGNSLSGSGTTRALNIEAINGSFICEKNIDPPANIASASSITVDQNTNFAIVTGTTTITNIVTDTAKYQRGRFLTILFTDALQVTDGGNLRLVGNLTTAFGTTLTLVNENGNWYEVSRAITQ